MTAIPSNKEIAKHLNVAKLSTQISFLLRCILSLSGPPLESKRYNMERTYAIMGSGRPAVFKHIEEVHN